MEKTSDFKGLEKQPRPIETDKSRIVIPYIIADLEERAVRATKEHGTPLLTHNGRDALVDAYQEQLDSVFYLKQAMLEIEDYKKQIAVLKEQVESLKIKKSAQEREFTLSLKNESVLTSFYNKIIGRPNNKRLMITKLLHKVEVLEEEKEQFKDIILSFKAEFERKKEEDSWNSKNNKNKNR